MTLAIELNPEEEARLQVLAQRRGVAPEDYVRLLLAEQPFPRSEEIVKNAASIALLEKWLAEAPTDPEAIAEAEADLREFKHQMNLTRREAGARLLYPEVE